MDRTVGLMDTSYNLTDVCSTIIVTLECLLVIGMIWLIFKKNNSYDCNLSKSDEEYILSAYRSQNLVEDVDLSKNNVALNPRVVKGKIGLYLNINGFNCVNFSTHDYFGLIGNKNIEDKVMKCMDTYGVGSCGPRGFYGTALEHVELEQKLADIFNVESSIIYSYGFATIASAIPAYAKKTDIIFVDEKCNFATQKGLEASKSEVKYFKHNDVKDLEEIMEGQHRRDSKNMKKARKIRKYLVIEGIYINTGDICPLPDLIKLCKIYKVRVILDESVSFGTLGATGKGVTEYFGVAHSDVDLIMGSFEYALASVGGFCVGSRLLIDHQLVSGLGYCFSASLPPLLATAVIGALKVIQNKAAGLNKLCRLMHLKLNSSTMINNHFLITGDQDSPIHMLTIKNKISTTDAADTIVNTILNVCMLKHVALTRASSHKEDKAGVGSAIRITTNLYHTEEHILHLILVLEEACNDI